MDLFNPNHVAIAYERENKLCFDGQFVLFLLLSVETYIIRETISLIHFHFQSDCDSERESVLSWLRYCDTFLFILCFRSFAFIHMYQRPL
jgi:hypothetical protein